MKNIEKVIIIGALRSGTNILRDVLTSFDGMCTWPCDEINYIWRHGNARFTSDEFPATCAHQYARQYINNAFNDIADRYSSDLVVEKTCANSLRVPFVDAVLPAAKYIFIYRDGIDATGSAKERWTANIDLPYILEKLKFVPKIDIPYYALRYLGARIHRLISKESRLGFWGPNLNGMQSLLRDHSLNEVCALQWQACVEKAEHGLLSISADRVIRLRYEDFVNQPVVEISRILKFLKREQNIDVVRAAVKLVSCNSIGKGRMALGEKEVCNLEQLVGGTLKRYGY